MAALKRDARRLASAAGTSPSGRRSV